MDYNAVWLVTIQLARGGCTDFFLVQLNVSAARSNTRSFDPSVPIPLQQSGLLEYMLPQFTLKN